MSKPKIGYGKPPEDLDIAAKDIPLEGLAKTFFKLTYEYEKRKEYADEALHAAQAIQRILMQRMIDGEVKNIRVDGGMVFIQFRTSVKMEDRNKFMKALEKAGVKEDFITIHSQTLNAFFNREEESEELLPGIHKNPTKYGLTVTPWHTLGARKTRGKGNR